MKILNSEGQVKNGSYFVEAILAAILNLNIFLMKTLKRIPILNFKTLREILSSQQILWYVAICCQKCVDEEKDMFWNPSSCRSKLQYAFHKPSILRYPVGYFKSLWNLKISLHNFWQKKTFWSILSITLAEPNVKFKINSFRWLQGKFPWTGHRNWT